MASCSKILSKTDTSKALLVPTAYLNSLPSFNGGHAMSFQAMDESGFVWTFKCSTRKNNRYRKPVLSKGWLASVRNKKLKVGDKIKFSVLNQTAGVPSYGVQAEKVQAEKEVKIFGAIFGYSPIIAPSIP
ncbi:B3 domain-containing transcription factor [Salix suchowensis]|nr:B3 domain-containing transcription factor [Salix suchowensis]